MKTLGGDAGIRKSTCAKYPVDMLRYDGFLDQHYAYMVKVLEEIEPTCFKDCTLFIYVKRTNRGIVPVVIYADDLIVTGGSSQQLPYQA